MKSMAKKSGCCSGMTVIEMLVAIGIFTLGIAGFTLLFIKAWQSNAYTLEMGQSSLMVSEGVSKMVNYIRGARQGDDGSYPVKSAADNDLVIFSDYNKDGVTERLHFYKSGQNILMGVTPPTGGMPKTYPAGDQRIVALAGSIVNAADAPIFLYFNKNYPGDTVNNPLATPAGVSDIRLVKIHLYVNIDPSRAPDNIEMQNFVEMRNLNDYNRLK